MQEPIRLNVLMRKRNLHRYGMFLAEYDKTAQKLDRDLIGTSPSRAQLHRWTSGQLRGVPHVGHCRVLEAMFPGWTAQQLFAVCVDEMEVDPGQNPASPVADVRPPYDLDLASASPISIRPHVDDAFQRDHVSIDFFGFSGETLHGLIQEPLDKIRIGQLTPKTLSIRILVPDTTNPIAVPCRQDDLSDDPAFRDRATRILLRHGQAILDSVEEITALDLVDDVSAEIRVHGCPPLFKLYILNHDEAFFGFYPIAEHTVTIKGTEHPMYDLMGKDASLFRHSNHGGTPTDARYVSQAQTWFNTVWNTISREFTA